MSLSGLLTAYVEFVGDRIVNVCGVTEIPRVLRYHGHAVPPSIECADGVLSAWWEPSIVPKNPAQPCPGYPVVILQARYVRCWKSPEVDSDGITLFDSTWDADAAALADLAECVSRALMQISCQAGTRPGTGDEFEQALLTLSDAPRFLGAAPVGPGGKVAGVSWRMQFGIRPEPAPGPTPQLLGRTADDDLSIDFT